MVLLCVYSFPLALLGPAATPTPTAVVVQQEAMVTLEGGAAGVERVKDRLIVSVERTAVMEIVGAIVGGLIAWAISIPIFGVRGGRMVRPGGIEYDPARGDVPPGGCLKSLANLAFIVLGAVVGAIVASGLG